MTNHLTLSSHFKIVIYSIHTEEVYRRALAFVNTVEYILSNVEGPTACGGLARAYYSKTGAALTTLNEVIDAVIAGDLAGVEAKPVWLAELHPELIEGAA